MKCVSDNIRTATKWSFITEIIAKLVSPITSMVLARLLTPEMFGIVATVNVIISFTDMFTDAGFQKYLVQHEFQDDKDRKDSTTVAFWTNLVISLFLWGFIILFRNELAALVGNPGKGLVVAVSCAALPMTSFSSIQMSLYKRDFDFKTLFFVRVAGILIPLILTIPLALIFRNYWALVIGELARQLVNAIILTIRSTWKPTIYYSINKLKEMLSFSIWTLLEQISIWLTNYVGTFIVGVYLSSYYVGLYKTAMNTVTQFITLITAATTPVLFSALSRTQNNGKEFRNIYYNFQHKVSILLIPICVGIFLYRELIVLILLGDQWKEITMFIGLWGITSGLGVLLNNYASEVYRALGKPKISLFVQVLHICFLIPTLMISAQKGFETLYWARSLIRFQMYITQMIVIYFVAKISFWKILKNIYSSIIAAFIMGMVGFALQYVKDSIVWDFISIAICIVVYTGIVLLFKKNRMFLKNLVRNRKRIC